MKPFFVALIVCFLTLPAYGQSGLAFLRIGLDAAALAMGDAQVSHTRDAFSTYWNPAGLAAARSNSVAVSHHVWVADVRTYGFTSRFRAGAHGGVGLFITATGSGDLEARERPGAADGFFDAQYLAAGAAYGRTIGPLRAGVTAKFLSERIFTDDATGYAVDFGLQLDVLDGGLQLGAALQNLGEMNNLSSRASTLPRLVRVGATVFPFRVLAADDNAPILNAILLVEVSHDATDDATRFHLGAGAEVLDMLTLRAGYLSNDALRSVSGGIGLRFTGFRFDYALLPFAEGFNGPGHIFTLLYGW